MELVGPLALVAATLVLAGLAAGLVERAPVSFPILFLGLGLLLGPGATGALTLTLDAPLLELVALTTLSLVLFLDAVHLEIDAVRGGWVVPVLTLGPGTLLVIGGIAAAAVALLGLTWPVALVAGAALASTDPVVLRDLVRDRRLPGSVRHSLQVEAGTNDLIVLPAVLVLTAVARAEDTGAGDWLGFLAQLLVVGPVLGALVGWLGARLMAAIDARAPVREEYQSIYGVGLVLLAFVAGETLGTDGFLAAFAAGLAVGVGNAELCSCFLDFGQTLAEVLMLVAFVLFGVVLSASLGEVPPVPVAVLAVVAVLLIRPVAVGSVLSLRRVGLSPPARAFIAWFGPRGLNSLLLALLAVREGLPGGDAVFAAVGAVVALSVVVHGASATPLANAYARRVAASVLPEERESTAGAVLGPGRGDTSPRIEADELARLLDGEDPPLVVDVRARSALGRGVRAIPGAVRVPPDEVATRLADERRDRLIALYCT